LDETSVRVPALHERLLPEHFTDGQVPPLHKLRSRLNGEGMNWDLVEAVLDVCFPTEPSARTQQRLTQAKRLWDAAQSQATTPAPCTEPSPREGELLAAQKYALEAQSQRAIAQAQAIEAYQELNEARQALEASERGRQQALRVGTMLFAMLGTAEATVFDLERRIGAHESSPAMPPADDLEKLRQQLRHAEQQERDLRAQLAQAEADRTRAQQVAGYAARRIQALEEELSHYQQITDQPGATAEPSYTQQSALDLRGFGADLLDLDQAQQRARSMLDQEREAVTAAASELGAPPPLSDMPGPAYGAQYTAFPPGPFGGPLGGNPEAQLFDTTPNNSAARVLSLAQQTADQALAEARAEANKIVAEARKEARRTVEEGRQELANLKNDQHMSQRERAELPSRHHANAREELRSHGPTP
jgi:cell division septum initiation protein DivIVA